MSVMLFKDCAKVDLQHVNDSGLIKKTDIAKMALPQDLTAGSFGGLQASLIRGQTDPPEIFRSYPPIFLATQRLRI